MIGDKHDTEAADFIHKDGVVGERRLYVEGGWRLNLESKRVSMQT